MSPEAGLGKGRTAPGLLVAIVGPSGVGKDALMSAAARHPAIDGGIRFARRVVTRPAVAGSEDHESLDEAAFLRAEATGAFALAWAAHGLRYGLRASVATEIADGRMVVANLSRHALAEAGARFGRLRIVEITAEPDILLGRLIARGRECATTIRERVARQVPLQMPPAAEGHFRLDNSGELGAATERLVRHLNGLRSPE